MEEQIGPHLDGLGEAHGGVRASERRPKLHAGYLAKEQREQLGLLGQDHHGKLMSGRGHQA